MPSKNDTPLVAPEAPIEPEPFTLAWFDGVIAANQNIAQQKYDEWQQLQGAIAMLIQQRALIGQGAANDDPSSNG